MPYIVKLNFISFRWAELPYYRRVCGPEAGGIPGRTTLEGWLARWALHISEMRRFVDLPLYLQYLCKILFHVVDRESEYYTTFVNFYYFWVDTFYKAFNRAEVSENN